MYNSTYVYNSAYMYNSTYMYNRYCNPYSGPDELCCDKLFWKWFENPGPQDYYTMCGAIGTEAMDR